MFKRSPGKSTVRKGRPSLRTAFAAAVLGVVITAAAVTGLLYWSTHRVDELSLDRQQRLVQKVLAQSAHQIGHDQESVTVWDDAVVRLREPVLDLDWFDNNLGVWLHEFYGHDAAYVLDPNGRPLYSMADGVRGAPQDFMAIANQVRPMVAKLRTSMREQPVGSVPAHDMSPVASDLMVINGRPSIVSVKPIVSDTGDLEQVAGTEAVHIAVRHLDGNFATAIREDYAFEGGRFVPPGLPLAPGESARPLLSRDGQPIGQFAWRPFAPGSQVFERLAPVLLFVSALVGGIVLLLLRRIAKRTRELRESNDTVRHLAFHDPLTGLPNRALFEDRLGHALQVFRRTADRPLALLFLDLDRFKAVNDTLGHAAGDELIREFGRRLAGAIRASDTAARLGGDEFAIIQTDVSSPNDIDELCQRIIQAAAVPFTISGSQVHVGVSIGVALSGKDGLDPAELTRRADIALYEVKATGRGHYALFNPAMDEPIRARQNAERDLRTALESGDQLSLVYQPTYSTSDGTIAGVEALLRWRHPEVGNLSPSIFIPVAEESGLIEPLGEWVIEQACRDAMHWPVETVSINVSPVQLRNPHFATRAIAIMSRTGIDPARVEFELTETAIVGDAGQCAVNLRLLREFGVRVALDDFGTGYSSFSHFNQFEVDRVKIDRTFVDKIDVSEGGSAIIQAIVDLARSSGFRTTAEGVETEEQRAFLERVGCDEMQGFLLARPVPPAQIDTLFGVSRPPEAESQRSTNVAAA